MIVGIGGEGWGVEALSNDVKMCAPHCIASIRPTVFHRTIHVQYCRHLLSSYPWKKEIRLR